MTKYLESTPFSNGAASDDYLRNWARTFGKKKDGVCHKCGEVTLYREEDYEHESQGWFCMECDSAVGPS